MILGIGMDLVDIERIARAAERGSGRFVRKYYTEGEAAYSNAMPVPAAHLAARFAAKEAASKALGTGISSGVRFSDIEVLHEPSGQPRLALHGKTAELARAMGVTRTHVTLTHTATVAAATVIFEGEDK